MRVFGMITTKASEDYTIQALSSFIENTPLRPFDRFVLIDNDNCFGELPDPFRTFGKKVSNSQPKSFAANVNDTMAEAFSERAELLFLNNDLIFPHRWLEPLLIPEISILSPLSNREIQHVYKNFTWANALSLADYLPRKDEFREVVELHQQSVRGFEQVLSLPFFCVKIPYLVYSELGPLDERFGKGGAEDYDYCLRAAEKGIPVRYIAESYVLHFSGKSTWSGGEEPDAARNRREKYSNEFEKKWGKALRQILIEEDKSVIKAYPEIEALLSRGKLSEAIVALKTAGPS